LIWAMRQRGMKTLPPDEILSLIRLSLSVIFLSSSLGGGVGFFDFLLSSSSAFLACAAS
jgi:hypothetical protein